MRRSARGVATVAVGVAWGALACSPANLDAITHGPTVADGGGSSPDGAVAQVCPTQVLAAGDTTQNLVSGGNNRNYFLHVPAAYDGTKPVPLILDFHGLTTNGARERANSPYPGQTDSEGVIMAFPSGMTGPSGAAWNVGPCCVAGVDDVAFAKQVVADVMTMACIDAKRVYAVGFSMGGGMAHYLGCHAADVFAGVAPASFDLLQENLGDCKPARPIVVISFRGTADTLVPYDGGPSSVVPNMSITFLGAQATFKKWADLDQCTGSPSAEDSNGCATYSTCQGGVEVVLCSKQGGGQEAGNPAIAWPILKRHPLP